MGGNWYAYCNCNPITFVDLDGLSTTRDDFAYQLRSEGKTELAAKLEKDADNANQGYTPEINNPAVYPSLWNLLNLDFGRDYADLALRNFRNGHLVVGTGTLLRSGIAGPLFGHSGGGLQYDLMINGKNVGEFVNERLIK